MFEKYIGRKESPKVTIEEERVLEGVSNEWRETITAKPDLMEWFSGSVVADSAGKPIPVFHGTRSTAGFAAVYTGGRVSELGVHFGAAEAANTRLKDTFDSSVDRRSPRKSYEMTREYILKSRIPDAQKEEELQELESAYSEEERVYQEQRDAGVFGGETLYPVFLKITNPVRVSDPGSFTAHNLSKIKKDLIRNFMPRDQVVRIESAHTVEDLRQTLIGLGYDGVVYKNEAEGEGSDSYIPIVGPEQIRSAI